VRHAVIGRAVGKWCQRLPLVFVCLAMFMAGQVHLCRVTLCDSIWHMMLRSFEVVFL